MFCALLVQDITGTRYQMSVYRTIGPLVFKMVDVNAETEFIKQWFHRICKKNRT